MKSPAPQSPLHASLAEDVLRMQAARVFVVGDLILDQYLSGKVSRISPEAPVPVLLESAQKSVLGGAANTAANIASFGAAPSLAGRIGDDPDGDHLIRLCAAKGIDTAAVVRNVHQPTIRKLRVLAGYQQIVRIDAETNERIDPGAEDLILAKFDHFLSGGGDRALVISDYGKGVCTPRLLAELIQRASASGVPVVTDPKSSDLSRYRGTTYIKPNLSEGREILRRKEPGTWHEDLDSEVAAILKTVEADCQARHVVLSLSEKGVVASTAGSPSVIRFRSEVLQVADVSGAGDTMIAFLAMAAACRLPVARAVQLANIAAGTVCGKLGTATISRAEFMEAFQDREGATRPEKIISHEEARQIAANYREAGKSVVFTNGCFDLLHAGHVSLLQAARGLGDVLFLGLNSDASIKRLKGPERPIQNESDRATIMAGLACVNYVVLFEEDTPLELIATVNPDIIVKGGDYRPDEVVGADIVSRNGGKVVIVPLLEGRSTTRIIESSTRGRN